MELKAQIQQEISQYLTETVSIGENYQYSQYRLIRRIILFENHIYPSGKWDSQGNYKYWFDIITPRIDAEVKNIDFDTKDVDVTSDRKDDALACLICNLRLKEYMRTTGQAEEINSAIEEGSGWGNVVWKMVKGGYERMDLKNFYPVNITAPTLGRTGANERYEMSASELQEKSGVWKYTDEVIKNCRSNTYKRVADDLPVNTTTPFYEIYERNGEVCLADLKRVNGETPKKSDENKYVLAKIVAAGKSSMNNVTIDYIMFAEELKELPYQEFHRSRYKGRWFREGLYELLFDVQVRLNQIGNQIAQGLEFASKTLFQSEDRLVVQNVLTDLQNGDIIKTKGISHVPVRMEGFDQLANEWNRLIQLADSIANSQEVVQGENLPSGTSFRLGNLLNSNANKLFDFIREKLAIPLSEMFERWIIPELVKDLKVKDILRLTGDSEMLARLNQIIVDNWYIDNLVEIGPHTPEIAEALKQEKMDELKSRTELMMVGIKKLFKDFYPSASVVITGENSNKPSELQTLATFINLEMDPVRRTGLIEKAMRRQGVDVGGLPKSPPAPLPSPQPIQAQREPAPAQRAAQNVV